ncbi:MAG: 23S rRNA (adenine(2503)-C(2))-methyltransferase RlmN, partial [Candidatus Omnitrophica bacterium]|nr:23S rRNA (adenine(2503)-C(2))-methyltransferase RlmN [Candidatus Omnitrophota bacterium]
ARRISISTCGLVPEIYKLAELDLKIKLSVSLHAANNDLRNQLMPINQKYPLELLIPAIEQFSKISNHSVIFEYVLMKDRNTKKEDAVELAQLIVQTGAKLNIIVYNGSSLDFSPPQEEEIDNFKKELNKKGIFFTLRKSRGQDINAACGQLKSKIE